MSSTRCSTPANHERNSAMSKLKHHHAIPATLRGNSRGIPPTILDTEFGRIEEGCRERILTVFSDSEASDAELEKKLIALGDEYEAHLKLAQATVDATINSRKAKVKPAQPQAQTLLDAQFEKFLKGSFVEFAAFVSQTPNAIKQLRCYSNGKVISIEPGLVRIKRDTNQSTLTLIYPLSTKLKVGDNVFVRDNGAKPIPTVQAVWVNVKDHAVRGDELKQFF